MSTLTHGKILQVINKFMNFTSKNCACEVSRNFKNPITDETQKKPINCCYTCMTMGILMTLYLLNGDILLDIENFPKNIKLPKGIIKEDITYDKYFLGITNSIGLLWDIHCLLENPFIPCGVEIALNDESLKTQWYRSETTLEQGINILVFHATRENPKIVFHNSFIFVKDEICYLIDSWWGNSYIDNKDFSKIAIYQSELMCRKHSLSAMQTYIDIINNEDRKYNKKKKCIFVSIFNAPNGIGDAYFHRNIKILNNNILNEKISEGFSSETSIFGGYKNNYYKKYIKYKNKYKNMV